MKHAPLHAPLALAAMMAIATPALAHDIVQYGDSTIEVLLTKEESGGSLGMFIVDRNVPEYAPVHIHEDADEIYFLLDGVVTFILDGEQTTIGEGESIFVPRGVEHAYRHESQGGRTLIIVSPGGFEGFYSAVLEQGLTAPDDLEEIFEIGEDFGLQIVGPPFRP